MINNDKYRIEQILKGIDANEHLEDKTKERLKKEFTPFLENLRDYYVFDKYIRGNDTDEDDEHECVSFFAFSSKKENDEDPDNEDIYGYNRFFLEVHDVYIDEDWKERIKIYANNNCVRECCGTWEILNILI
jgi:hypothetical protein